MRLKWVWSGMTVLVESVSLWGLHSSPALHENGALSLIGCAALAAVILMGCYARTNPRFQSHTRKLYQHQASGKALYRSASA